MVRTVLQCHPQAVTDYEVRLLFGQFEPDSTGCIELGDLLHFLQQGPTKTEDTARKVARMKRVRKNISLAAFKLSSDVKHIEELFRKIDMDGDINLSLVEFTFFMRHELALSRWDVSNRDLEDFYNELDENGDGVGVEELLNFVRHNEKRKEEMGVGTHSLYVRPDVPKARRRKTHMQQLLDGIPNKSDRYVPKPNSQSLPSLHDMRVTTAFANVGRSRAPATRSALTMSSMMFFAPEKHGAYAKSDSSSVNVKLPTVSKPKITYV